MRSTVRATGFTDATAQTALPAPPKPREQAAAVSPVEILFKPQPAYSEEARKLRIEGAVALEVLFARSGEVRVRRLLRGLGHGLDERAVQAAEQIRFKPAHRDGEPIDSTATVELTFQLAY